jgi:hypothetical protein
MPVIHFAGEPVVGVEFFGFEKLAGGLLEKRSGSSVHSW